MAELKRYLYDGLSFKINTGIVPIIVNNTVINAKQSVPHVIWSLDFGKVDMGLKNSIDETIFLEPDDTFITSYVGPSFYIGKRVNPVGSVNEYYLTYLFEYKYYTTFVNRPLTYIVDGSDDLIEGAIRIPSNQGSGDTPIVIAGAQPLPRKLFYTQEDLDIGHSFNNVFTMKAKFTELASPLTYTEMFIAGESSADNSLYC